VAKLSGGVAVIKVVAATRPVASPDFTALAWSRGA
jgi:hypothetical protein